jgi:hypothetical protein
MIQELNEIATQLDLQTDLIDEIKNIQLDLRQDFGVIFDAIVEGNGLLNQIKNSIDQTNLNTPAPPTLPTPPTPAPGQGGGGEGQGGAGFLGSNFLNQLSLPLPGGARIFGVGTLIQDVFSKNIKGINKFTSVIGLAAATALTMNRAFVAFSKELGTTPGQAARIYASAVGSSITTALTTGRILTPGDITSIQSAISQEFGSIISTELATQFAAAAQDLGITVDEFVKLERTLQGTGRGTRETIDRFRRVGINGRVAAQELNKNATAVARAGGEFNSFIVEGIKNAKKLGLEFSQIEKTLTGFATDFEGTVDSFANLRAVLPGFSADFNELFSTALYGSTDDYVELIRNGLLGSGVSDISQLNRLQVAQLEKTTGFTGDQLGRILAGQDAGMTMAESLDTERNSLLTSILGAIGALTGASLAGGISRSMATAASTRVGALGGTAARGTIARGATGLAARGAGLVAGATPLGLSLIAGSFLLPKLLELLLKRDGEVDDGIIQNGKIISTDPADTLIATKTPEELTSTTQEVNIDLSKLERKLDEINMTLKRDKKVEITGIDTGLESLQQRTIRNY